MENITIYPFGPDGRLPAGYPIQDDLKSDSAQKALSARQGKVIGDYIFGYYETEDLSGVTVSSYSLGAGTTSSNKWMADGLHFVYPVTPGQKIRLKVTSAETNGGFYAFFTDDYEAPTSTSDAVPYVSGTSRVWLESSGATGEVELVVPDGAAYVCCCPRDGSAKNSTWTIESFVDAGIDDVFVKQGSDELYSTIHVPVNIGSIAADNYTMLGTDKWGDSSAKHKAISVTPGEKLRIKASGSTGGGNFSAFLTSSYSEPVSNQGTVPYVSGTSRTWRNEAHGWIEVTCPATAAFLCLVTKNGDGDTTEWEVERLVDVPIRTAMEDYALKKSDVVNNLIDGGDNVPLSAEQGKVLYGKVSDGMPLGLTKHEYTGAPVVINQKHYVATKKVATITSIACQGGACYGDFLFMFTEDNTTCWIYNLATNALLQTYTIPSGERGFVSNCHCNTVNFGTEKYDEDDSFPLLYVSTGYNDGTASGVLVYRIIETTESDVTTYSLVLVQTVKIPVTNWTEFVVGEDGNCYISTSDALIYRMKMPELSQGDYTMDLENAREVYRFSHQPAWYNGSRNQGRLYRGGKMYLVSGVPSSNETSLFIVLNMATQMREVEIDLIETLGLTSEPEAIFIWRGHLCVAFRYNTGIYALYFE